MRRASVHGRVFDRHSGRPVGRGEDPVQEVDLRPDVRSALTGTVTSAGRPVAGLPLALRDQAVRQVATTVTDSRGRYHVDRLPAGQYTVDRTPCLPHAEPVAAEAASADLLLAPPCGRTRGPRPVAM